MRQLILILACLCWQQPLYCWGFYAHRVINEYAVYLLPPEMLALYLPMVGYLREHATDADKRRYIVKAEAPRHYIDMDHYGSYPYPELPRKWQDAVEKYSIDSLYAHGIVPWRILEVQRSLTEAFQQKNARAILKLSADLGHYIGDAHVPLHTSSNHNGQKTNQHGIHGFWESRLPELFAEKEWDFLMDKAGYIRKPSERVWKIVLESAQAADSVLSIEARLTARTPADQKFAYEWRNQQLLRQYSTLFSASYNQALNGMVERRMREAIHAVASFWYTAWVNAGQPRLTGLANGLGTEMDATLDSLDLQWKNTRANGRICED